MWENNMLLGIGQCKKSLGHRPVIKMIIQLICFLSVSKAVSPVFQSSGIAITLYICTNNTLIQINDTRYKILTMLDSIASSPLHQHVKNSEPKI